MNGVPRDCYTYSTLLSICQPGARLGTAMRLFREMQAEGLAPNTGAGGGPLLLPLRRTLCRPPAMGWRSCPAGPRAWHRAGKATGVPAGRGSPAVQLPLPACPPRQSYGAKAPRPAFPAVVVNALLSVCGAAGDADAAVQVYR